MSAQLQDAPLSLAPMELADLDAVILVERAAYPYPWTRGNFRDCLDSGYRCWVARQGGALVGYSILMAAAGEGHVLNCCVAPEWQGRGHGRTLMLDLMDAARHHGVECLFLEVRPSNLQALGLYAGLGFETVGLRRNYYPADQGREDAIIMRFCL